MEFSPGFKKIIFVAAVLVDFGCCIPNYLCFCLQVGIPVLVGSGEEASLNSWTL
jgi:hypothetical protein